MSSLVEDFNEADGHSKEQILLLFRSCGTVQELLQHV